MSLILPSGVSPQQVIPSNGKTSPVGGTGNKVTQHIPDGDAGARYTLQGMKNVVYNYSCKETVKKICEKITADAKTEGERIQAILRWAVSIMRYEKDPPEEELVKSPCRVLREAAQLGRATGDCDDYAVLLASCYRQLGIPCSFMAVSNQKMTLQSRDVPLDHVFTCAFDREKKQWVPTDPVAPGVNWNGHRFMTEVV